MIKVSLVTGTINRLELLKRLVESVRASVGTLTYEIVIVDNNSTDGTPDWCAAQQDIVYLNIGEPQGSIPAFNLGFSYAQGEYVVTLNDDIAVEGDTIRRAAAFLDNNPEVGQAAFAHKYQNRRKGAEDVPVIQRAFGYVYGQCCMTRKWLGDSVGWWGNEGMFHYGGDTRLSMAIWEMGYSCVEVPGCAVIDWEYMDGTRQRFDVAPRGGSKNRLHPDLPLFMSIWKDRLPPVSQWIAAPANRVVEKAAAGTLRTLRFKGSMNLALPPRVSCINAFGEYGPAMQFDKGKYIHTTRNGLAAYQDKVSEVVKEFQPDLVMFQAQGPRNSVQAHVVRRLRAEHPETLFFNWDGDTHYPITPWFFEIARAFELQLVVSPTVFTQYIENGVPHIGYWPIGVEQGFLDAVREKEPSGPDVVFLGSLFKNTTFPDWKTRNDAVLALSEAKDLTFGLYGRSWSRLGLRAQSTQERFDVNVKIHERAGMALSISQTHLHWGYSSDRLYNITATGCPVLIQRFAGMDEHGFVDGVSCIAWTTIGEMLDKARYYTAHPVQRERIGANGRAVTHSRHTWPHRVRGLLIMLGGMYHG